MLQIFRNFPATNSHPFTMKIPSIPGIAFLQDDDSHWYFCPASKVDEAREHLDTVVAFWRDIDGDPDECEPPAPDWLFRIVGGAPADVKPEWKGVVYIHKNYGE